MTKSYSKIEKVTIGCGKCHKEFQFDFPMIVNADTDPEYVDQMKDLSLFVAKCPNCGFEGQIPTYFLYHSKKDKVLWLIVPQNQQIRYLQALNTLNTLFEKYAQELPESEVLEIQTCDKRVVPITMFLRTINSPLINDQSALGYLHFTPFPKIELNLNGGKHFEKPQNIKIGEYEVGLVENNYPEFYSLLWEILESELRFRETDIETQKINKSQEPVGTYGFPELIIYIGSTIIVPVIIGALGNLISDLIIEKRKARSELEKSLEKSQEENNPRHELIAKRVKKLTDALENELLPSDKLSIKIRVLDNQTEYEIKGTIHEICSELRRIRKQAISNLRLPGDCHIVTYLGDTFLDNDDPDGIGKIEHLKSKYGKTFARTTRVRAASYQQAIYMLKSIGVANVAKELMAKQRYEEAALVLSDVVKGAETPVDTLYNYALCLQELGHTRDAEFLFEQVIIRSINLPPLGESAFIKTDNESTEDDVNLLKSIHEQTFGVDAKEKKEELRKLISQLSKNSKEDENAKEYLDELIAIAKFMGIDSAEEGD